jgi:hypothetical protein
MSTVPCGDFCRSAVLEDQCPIIRKQRSLFPKGAVRHNSNAEKQRNRRVKLRIFRGVKSSREENSDIWEAEFHTCRFTKQSKSKNPVENSKWLVLAKISPSWTRTMWVSGPDTAANLWIALYSGFGQLMIQNDFKMIEPWPCSILYLLKLSASNWKVQWPKMNGRKEMSICHQWAQRIKRSPGRPPWETVYMVTNQMFNMNHQQRSEASNQWPRESPSLKESKNESAKG